MSLILWSKIFDHYERVRVDIILLKKFVRLNRKYSKLIAEKYPRYFSSPSYKDELLRRISLSIEKGHVNRVLEVGGIDRPLLRKGQGYKYDGLDIESRDKCYEVYDDFIVQSIEQQVNEKYDLIVSITLMEHVPRVDSAFNSIYKSLQQNGETHHYIPSKWHPYAVALRIVGPAIQKRLIPILRPGAEEVTGYPAYFDKGSIPSMRNLLIKQGFTDIDIQAFYRANDYFAFFTPMFLLITAFENLCQKLELEIFASGFIISAKM